MFFSDRTVVASKSLLKFLGRCRRRAGREGTEGLPDFGRRNLGCGVQGRTSERREPFPAHSKYRIALRDLASPGPKGCRISYGSRFETQCACLDIFICIC